MAAIADFSLIQRKYRDAFGASPAPSFASYMHFGDRTDSGAALGYKRAGLEPLFLEAYLDEPVECSVSKVFGHLIERDSIVEIGNFAADNALAMVELWGTAANDLGERSEVAVATLTAPLRRMFARIGLPIHVLAPARPERIGRSASDWGSYYQLDPRVCAGKIAEGQEALAAFLQRRQRVAAA